MEEQSPSDRPSARTTWFDKLGTSGRLLVFGSAIGLFAMFLPVAHVSMQMGGPEGMRADNSAMVASNWKGALCLLGYGALLAMSFMIYPSSKSNGLTGATACIGVLVALFGLWLLVAVFNSGGVDMMGFGSVRVTPGIGALLNPAAGMAVAAGGLLKAREEKLF
jgi:hypothetical protein